MPRTDPAREVAVGRAAPGRGDDRLPTLDLAGLGIVGGTAAGEDLGQAPIHHLDLAEGPDHDVRRLDVAVDHPARVGVGDGLRDRLEDRQHPGQAVAGILASGQEPGERVPFHQLHAEERPAVAQGAHLVDRHDAGVLELAADLRLLDEPADHVGIVAEVLAEDLQRDVAPEVGVAALEHGADAAARDLAVDPVARALAGVAAPRAVERRLGPAVGVAEQDVRHLADARRKGLQDPSGGRPVVGRVARAIGPGLEALASPPPLELDGDQLGLEGGPERPVADGQMVLEPGPAAGSPRRFEAVAEPVDLLGLADRDRRRPSSPPVARPDARFAHESPSASQRLRMRASFRSTVRSPESRAAAISSLV